MYDRSYVSSIVLVDAKTAKAIGEIKNITTLYGVYGIPEHMFGEVYQVYGVSAEGNFIIKVNGSSVYVPCCLVEEML